jgi:hypothetical protein
MLRANAPGGVEKKAGLAATVAPVAPEPAAGEPPAPPAIEDDGVNDYLKRLVLPTQRKREEPPEDEVQHKWVKADPSKPDSGPQPVSDWNSDASNSPIY